MEELYSIVIPVYNSENSIMELSERIEKVFLTINKSYEVIFVNDCSPDHAHNVIKLICDMNSNIKYISLRKNFGQHNAQMAGFRHVSGDYVITMDDDLQNPPEEIPKLIKAIKESNKDIIFARFEEKKHSGYRRLGSKFVNWLNKKVVGKPDGLVLSNFRIIKREIIDELVKTVSPTPYVPGLLLMITNDCGNVLTDHKEREYGKSNYTMRRILKLVFSLLFNFSDFPLKLAVRSGLIISLLGFLFSGSLILKNIFFQVEVQGWTSTMFIISIFSSLNLLILAVVGQYFIRSFDIINKKPTYLIKEKKNL